MASTAPERSYAALFQGVDLAPARARILEGTAIAVSARGMGATTVQHILDAADVSRRTFYQHFANKDHALDALFAISCELVIRNVRLAVSGARDPASRVASALDAYLAIQRSGGALVIALQAEAVRPDSRLAPRREATLDRLVELFSGGASRLLGRTLDPLVFRSLFIGVEGLVLHLQAKGSFSHDDRERVRRVCLPIMLRALSPEHGRQLPLPGPPDETSPQAPKE